MPSDDRSPRSRSQHPATLPRASAVQPKSAESAPPPHPATVVQRKPALGQTSERPPHPATVVQPKRPFGGGAGEAVASSDHGRPPHPATVVQPKGRPPHPATVVQPSSFFKGLKSLFSGTKKVNFPGLVPGSKEWKGLYKLEHEFANYQIAGSFTPRPKGKTEATIEFIEKTEKSKGFPSLLDEFEKSSQELESTSVEVTFDQCKKEVVDKLKRSSSEKGWNFNVDSFLRPDETDLSTSTGPNIVLSKDLSKKE